MIILILLILIVCNTNVHACDNDVDNILKDMRDIIINHNVSKLNINGMIAYDVIEYHIPIGQEYTIKWDIVDGATHYDFVLYLVDRDSIVYYKRIDNNMITIKCPYSGHYIIAVRSIKVPSSNDVELECSEWAASINDKFATVDLNESHNKAWMLFGYMKDVKIKSIIIE